LPSSDQADELGASDGVIPALEDLPHPPPASGLGAGDDRRVRQLRARDRDDGRASAEERRGPGPINFGAAIARQIGVAKIATALTNKAIADGLRAERWNLALAVDPLRLIGEIRLVAGPRDLVKGGGTFALDLVSTGTCTSTATS
jgi:hypothetical protein